MPMATSCLVLSLLLVFVLSSCGADKNLKRGEKYLALGEYYDAANEFKTAYQKTPSKERDKRGQRARKMAYCYDRSLQTAKAIAAYRNAIRGYALLRLQRDNYRYELQN